MDKMIEEFSKWVINQGFDCKMPLRTVHGIQNADKQPVFSHAVVQACWQAWQASRQALVVKLPATCCRTLVFEIEGTNEVGMEHDEYYEVDDIISVLSDAGIKCT